MATIDKYNKLRLILASWSASLPIDDETGESIVTEYDLDRLTQILMIISTYDCQHLFEL